MIEEKPMPTPATTARPGITGTPVILSDGNTWILASTVPVWGPLWDQLHDQNVLRGRYEEEHILVGALALLIHNYRLTTEEAGALILGGDLGGMRDAIEAAMFLPGKARWQYSDWVMSSLIANGVNPKNVPDGLLPAVLDQLVRLGRAVPEHEFVASTAYAARRNKRRSLVRSVPPKPEEIATPEPPEIPTS